MGEDDGAAGRVASWIPRDVDLRARVALMRELGILQLDGIVLDPAWREPLPEVRPADSGTVDRSQVHEQYWRRLVRASGSPIPACSPNCSCGGWKDEHGIAGVGVKAG